MDNGLVWSIDDIDSQQLWISLYVLHYNAMRIWPNHCQLKACIWSDWNEMSSHIIANFKKCYCQKETRCQLNYELSHHRPNPNMRRKSIPFARVLIFPFVQETWTKCIKDNQQPRNKILLKIWRDKIKWFDACRPNSNPMKWKWFSLSNLVNIGRPYPSWFRQFRTVAIR